MSGGVNGDDIVEESDEEEGQSCIISLRFFGGGESEMASCSMEEKSTVFKGLFLSGSNEDIV